MDAVKLPERLASQPYLREYYGVVADCVRNIYFGYMGWFNADAATLEPLPYLERARRYVDLAGGPGPMLEKIRTALANREHSWAAELATWLVRADRNQLEARRLKARALRELGYRQISANRRNFYLTAALELEGKIPAIPNSTGGPDTVQALPPSTRVKSMAVMLDPEKSRDVRLTLGFQITDADQAFALEIREGVAEFHPTLPPARTATLVTSRRTLHSLLLGQTTLDKAVSSGEARVTGPQQAAASFFTYFDPWPRTIDARLSDR
ncbi:MAG: hypothetical protein HY013_07970 [Candidatus Solibacter usitatus]|nr:hypothetical protein [Candidatus Solibacter usitatus]